MYLSICIPSYNRPQELRRLLDSVDSAQYADEIEIVIQEDHAPLRDEVRKQVEQYQAHARFQVVYHENETNCGYDKNLRTVAERARGSMSFIWEMMMYSSREHSTDLFLF